MKRILFIGSVLFLSLTGCVDDLNTKHSVLPEGNFLISLSTKGGSRADIKDGNDDENYINIADGDYQFYLFDSDGKFKMSLGKDELTGSPTVKDDLTIFPYRFEDYVDIGTIMALTNLTGFNGISYPELNIGEELEDLYTEVAYSFTYPVNEDGATWVPSTGRGIPMFGIGEVEKDGNKQSATIPVIRSLAKIEIEYSDNTTQEDTSLANHTVIYIENNSSWNQVYLYSWEMQNVGVDGVTGAWPGMPPTGRTTIEGKEYLYYDLGAHKDGVRQNFILNNNNGLQILGPQNYYLDHNIYLELIDLEAGNLLSVDWRIVPSKYAHSGYTIHVNDNLGWDQLNLYLYEGNDRISPEWPGVSGIQDIIDGKKYWFFDLPAQWIEGNNPILIFNNGSSQLDDIPFSNLEFDDNHIIYLELEQRRDAITHTAHTVYVNDLTGWENLYLHMYGDVNDLGGPLPGMTPTGTKTINGKSFKYFLIGEEGVNKKENLQFNDDAGHQLPNYEHQFNSSIFLEIEEPFTNIIEIPKDNDFVERAYCLYVENNTGWDDLFVYIHGDRELLGGWPGASATEEEVINGKNYLKYQLPYGSQGLTANFIFNNGKDDDEKIQFDGPQEITLNGDLYISITANSYSEIETVKIDESVYQVYVEKPAEWDEICLYMWGAAELMGGWPGKISAGTESIDGKEYHYFNVPYSGKGLNENLIFNNNNKGDQTPDYNFTFNSDLRLTINSVHPIRVIDDITSGDFKLTIRKNIDWENLFIYSYGEGDNPEEIFGVWPGTELKNIENIIEITDFVGHKANLVFNNGGDKRFEYNNFKFDRDLYLSVEEGWPQRVTYLDPVERPVEEDYYFNGITLSMYGKDGRILPDLSISENSSWSVDGVGVSSPTLTNDPEIETTVPLKFVRDRHESGKQLWVAYVPEMNLSDIDPSIELDLKALPSVLPFKLKASMKGEETEALLRNHIYHFDVVLDYERLTIEYKVCDWYEETSGDIIFK